MARNQSSQQEAADRGGAKRFTGSGWYGQLVRVRPPGQTVTEDRTQQHTKGLTGYADQYARSHHFSGKEASCRRTIAPSAHACFLDVRSVTGWTGPVLRFPAPSSAARRSPVHGHSPRPDSRSCSQLKSMVDPRVHGHGGVHVRCWGLDLLGCQKRFSTREMDLVRSHSDGCFYRRDNERDQLSAQVRFQVGVADPSPPLERWTDFELPPFQREVLR